MDTLTLDTNIIRDWVWVEDKNSEIRYLNNPIIKKELVFLFSELEILRKSHICNIAITNQIFTDFEKDVGELPLFIDEVIETKVEYATPSISTFPMIFPFVFIAKSGARRTVIPGDAAQ